MPPKLAKDATVASVWPTLTYPRQYVATVRHRAELCLKKHGNALTRIGITGSGQKPCYRIAYIYESNELVWGSFWDNHDPLPVQDARNANWSTGSMSFEELDAFFKQAIGWKGKAS